MVLSDLLAALAGNTDLYITIADDSENTLITFNAPGYESIESDLGAYTVSGITVSSFKSITVTVAAES